MFIILLKKKNNHKSKINDININYNNNLIKSSTLINKLLNNRIIQKKGIIRPESTSTSQSLIRVLQTKAKSNSNNGVNNNKILKRSKLVI